MMPASQRLKHSPRMQETQILICEAVWAWMWVSGVPSQSLNFQAASIFWGGFSPFPSIVLEMEKSKSESWGSQLPNSPETVGI